jgi:hypothetical protein
VHRATVDPSRGEHRAQHVPGQEECDGPGQEAGDEQQPASQLEQPDQHGGGLGERDPVAVEGRGLGPVVDELAGAEQDEHDPRGDAQGGHGGHQAPQGAGADDLGDAR